MSGIPVFNFYILVAKIVDSCNGLPRDSYRSGCNLSSFLCNIKDISGLD